MQADKITRLRSFLELDPADSFTRFALAMELKKAGRADEAEKLYEELLSRDPDYVGVFYHLGKLREEQQRADDARKTYLDGIASAGRIGDAHAASELKQALAELEWEDD